MKDDQLMAHLLYLKLAYFQEQHQALAQEAVEKNWTQLDFLSRLAEGEALRRKDRATQRRLQAARFPVLKTLEQFNWTWPKKINRTQVQNFIFIHAWGTMAAGCHPVPELTWAEGSQAGADEDMSMFMPGMLVWASDRTGNPKMTR